MLGPLKLQNIGSQEIRIYLSWHLFAENVAHRRGTPKSRQTLHHWTVESLSTCDTPPAHYWNLLQRSKRCQMQQNIGKIVKQCCKSCGCCGMSETIRPIPWWFWQAKCANKSVCWTWCQNLTFPQQLNDSTFDAWFHVTSSGWPGCWGSKLLFVSSHHGPLWLWFELRVSFFSVEFRSHTRSLL